jgi:hypothetical protein
METGLEVARKELVVAFEGAPGQGRIDDLLDYDEAVAGEGVRLTVAQLELECTLVAQRFAPSCSMLSSGQTWAR